MSVVSPPDLLVLHALRIKGFADARGIAHRYGLSSQLVDELVLDHEATGLVRRVEFADVRGWSLTDAGRSEDERLLAVELDGAGARAAVTQVHLHFLALNARLLETITRWQLRPMPGDAMAANDHTDWRWDERVLDDLASLARTLRPLTDQLTERLDRFDGYAERFTVALERVDRGERRWVDEPRIDSCHTVWFELHEDLLSTLGRERGREE